MHKTTRPQPGHLPRVAAVTMAYNEAFFLPIWVRHHAREVGAANTYVLDHGSTDGSTAGLPCRVVPVPRGVLDEPARAALVSQFCAGLLGEYDAVLHSDADELVLADPRHHASVSAYAGLMPADVVTAVGLDLHHLPGAEPALDPARPLGAQRRWVRFAASMCKPALIRRPVAWAPGFHCADAPLVLDQLWLFHLRYADLDAGLARLARTRATVVADEAAHRHQRVPDVQFEALMAGVAALPQRQDVPFDPALPPLLRWTEALRESRRTREHELYKLDLSLAGDELWAVPERFRATL